MSKKLCEDARLAAECLKETNTFPTGQSILFECADRIEQLERERNAWRSQIGNICALVPIPDVIRVTGTIGDLVAWLNERVTYAEASEAKLAKAIRVMTALQQDMLERSRAGMDTIHGKEYRIVNAGRTAWIEFCAALAELEGKE